MKKDHIGQHYKSFTFIRVIGKGAWAKVYEAIDDNDDNTVAIKVIQKELISKTPKLSELIKTQIKVLRSCHNQNVIQFIDSFKTSKEIFIATQFCNGGDLEEYLDQKNVLSQDEATMFLKQILNGFKGLHQVKAMHRDFKVANVLLHNGICKIADLGFAKQMQDKDLAKTILGTSLTMAPQVLQSKPYGYEADIWSIGVVYYQMMFGKYPFMGKNDYDILKKIKNLKPDFSKVNISSDAEDFISKCLTVDPKSRISWVEIYQHPLLTKQQNAFIYGLKSKININQNKNFYQHNQLQNNNYPNIKKQIFDVNGVQFSDVNNMEESSNMNSLLQQANKKHKKQKCFQVYQKNYLRKRNDIMFVFKFISPFVPHFSYLKANHGITLFIMSKKALIEIKQFFKNMLDRKDIFDFKEYFPQFINSKLYKNILSQIQNDLSIVQIHCTSYKFDIQICNEEIQAQFDLEKIASNNFAKLINETVEQYWFQLAYSLSEVKDKQKQNLIKILQALFYYKKNSKAIVDQFDLKMGLLDYQEAEKDIMNKCSSIFD